MQVAAGGGHTYTIFMAGEGLVFACGLNDNGQLGFGDTELRLVPTLVLGQLQLLRCNIGDRHALHHSGSLVKFLGATMRVDSWVSGVQGIHTCQRWLQGCRAST